MAFEQTIYTISHTVSKDLDQYQPVIFQVDLSELVTRGGTSALFVIENVRLNGYRQPDMGKIPVRFSVFNTTRERILTHDPCKRSSKWQVDSSYGSYLKIAGTNTFPFSRNHPIHEDESRQALLNIFSFMMSKSLWTTYRARGVWEDIISSGITQFDITCEFCSYPGRVSVTEASPGCVASFSFPECKDGYACVPTTESSHAAGGCAVAKLLALVRSASIDNLDIFRLIADRTPDSGFQHLYDGRIVVSQTWLQYTLSLYESMSKFADIFGIVDYTNAYIKVLVESPSERLGYIEGEITLTLIYGSSILEICQKVKGEQDMEENGHIDGYEPVCVTQYSNQVLLRKCPLCFHVTDPMALKDWCAYYYGRRT